MEALIPSRAEGCLSANSSRWHVHFWKCFPRLSNRSMGCGGEGAETGRYGQNKCCRGDGEIHLITCEFLFTWCSAWGLTTPWCQEIQLWHPGKELWKAVWLSETEIALALTAPHYFSQNTPFFTRWALQVIQPFCREDSAATVVSFHVCLFAFRRSRMLFLEVRGLAVLPTVELSSLSAVWLREISCKIQSLLISLKWKYPGLLSFSPLAGMHVCSTSKADTWEGKEHRGLRASSELDKETLSQRKCSGGFNSAFAMQCLPRVFPYPSFPYS